MTKREWRRYHLIRRGYLGSSLIIAAFRKPANQLHASIFGRQSQHASEVFCGFLEKECLALSIQFTHPPNVASKVAFGQKVRQDCLFHQRRGQPCTGASSQETIKQRWRHHHIAQSQGREEHLAQGADIDDSSFMIKSL